MGFCLNAGLSLKEFYNCELWECSVIINAHFKERSDDYKQRCEIARLQMSAMTDISKLIFEWEKDADEMTPERWERTRKHFKQWEQNYQNEVNGRK